MKLDKNQECKLCKPKETIRYVVIDVFEGDLCPNCYIIKMLEALCKKQKIKCYSIPSENLIKKIGDLKKYNKGSE